MTLNHLPNGLNVGQSGVIQRWDKTHNLTEILRELFSSFGFSMVINSRERILRAAVKSESAC
jgi:hypothetical protein